MRQNIMLTYTAKHEFLIGIDSDGCTFDTMELKHKECFIPQTISHWGLQGVSKYAREAAEFVNLYSKSRGVNRFPGLIETLEWLQKRAEVAARGVKIEIPQELIDWVKSETKLGNPALKKTVEATQDPILAKTLAWSEAVNRQVGEIVREGVPPFPFVRESLEKMTDRADILVVSATPQEALIREWEEQDLAKYTAEICGQEIGTKKESLGYAQQVGNYAVNHILMVGDAPGDYRAAMANNALFFPINPGTEEKSWEKLDKEGLNRFFDGTFAGDYQKALLDEFDSYLPEKPSWKLI
ncbi:MAG: HAD family hydrolase [Planctomycetaceae bacterium]|nr:HAD family hydrolase [Planctomycetaceae bacterium]